MANSALKNFYKKNILIIITTVIILSIILSNISNFFIYSTPLPVITINQEKIYPPILQLNYRIMKKNEQKKIKNILSTTIQKKEFAQYIFQKMITKTINESLFKQYVDKIQLKMLNKHAKKIILSSKYFQVNNSFSHEKYLRFINFIMYSHKKYLHALQKKIAVKYLIKILLTSTIVLKHDIQKKFKKIIDKKNISIINFKISKKNIFNKSYTSKILKNLYLNKDTFQKSQMYVIKTVNLKKKSLKNQNIKNNIKLYSHKIKKIIKNKKYNYHCIQTNNFKKAYIFKKNMNNKTPFKKINNSLFNDNKNDITNVNLGWIKKKNIPFLIKKCQLKKIGDCSKIIFYKNNFFIFTLHDIKKTKIKNINKFNQYIIKKIQYNNLFFKNMILNNKINGLLKKKEVQLEKILPEKYTKIHTKKFLNYHDLTKYVYIHTLNPSLKDFISLQKKNNFYTPIKICKNVKNNIRLLQIKSCSNNIKKKQQFFKEFIVKNTNKINYLNIKKFLLTDHNKKIFFIKKHPIYSSSTQTISYKKNIEIMNIIKKIPNLKKNKSIYFLLKNSNNKYMLIILKKQFFKKFNTAKKKNIIKQIKQYIKIKVIMAILQNLYKTSKIIFNPNIK
ncbi:SurA N-terminal domain-containing protein [Buchnera aphidicola]|uniref:Peptidyl-prolyl cis-trans isomerase D n=1 Tax=Buchnera aphidicola (Cinara cf. splendens/pseudotsugae 3390) TaxID=2518980 RepID=A0A451CX06_9GAMM|nr:SurA N-terminal domain-containing protein [Buchnera aphidicola]VFP77880.1 Peptidyl-prolyl cis-trans isomerase D [Buchnera aphidicola (Cinara cf. splendens/pseudotsugae 3390)]